MLNIFLKLKEFKDKRRRKNYYVKMLKNYYVSESGEKVYTDTFCSNCLRHEDFFVGGGPCNPDICPCGCENTIPWYQLTGLHQIKATKLYEILRP